MGSFSDALIVKDSDTTGWRIGREGSDGPFMLIHDKYLPITAIVTFDEACRLRDSFRTGRMISFIRGYENFLIEFRKRI